MRHLFPILVFVLAPLFASAQDLASAEADAPAGTGQALDPVESWEADRGRIFDAEEIDPDAFLYLARPVVIFADTPHDPRFIRQMEWIEDEISLLAARDAIVIADTSPSEPSALRRILRPRGFTLVLIGKDGRIAQRKPQPWSVREVVHAIDKLPLRQQEIREGR